MDNLFADYPIDALAFQALKDNVRLPSDSWSWNHNGKTAVCITWLDAPDGNLVMKTLRVLSTTGVSFHVGGKLISLPNANGDYRDYDELSGFLKIFDGLNVCRGILDPELVNVSVTGKCNVCKDGDVWRSTCCSSLANSTRELCTGCSKALRYLRKRARNPQKIRIATRKLAVANQKIRRMKSREMVTRNILNFHETSFHQ